MIRMILMIFEVLINHSITNIPGAESRIIRYPENAFPTAEIPPESFGNLRLSSDVPFR